MNNIKIYTVSLINFPEFITDLLTLKFSHTDCSGTLITRN